MKSIDINLSDKTLDNAAGLGGLLARYYSNGSAYPAFKGDNFARFIPDFSGILQGKRFSSQSLALQVRATALGVLWQDHVLCWIHRPIIIESGEIPRHRDDDRMTGGYGNSIKKINDAVTLIIALSGFNDEGNILHSEGSADIDIGGDGKKLIIHDQMREHWVENLGSDKGKQKLWWSGLIKRSIAEKKGFI